MGDDDNVLSIDLSLVAEIVRRYVAENSIVVDQIGGLIATVHATLSGLVTNTPAVARAAERLTPAVPIRRSVQPEYVVCLECGFRGRICAGICECYMAWKRRLIGPAGNWHLIIPNCSRLFGATLGDGQTGSHSAATGPRVRNSDSRPVGRSAPAS